MKEQCKTVDSSGTWAYEKVGLRQMLTGFRGYLCYHLRTLQINRAQSQPLCRDSSGRRQLMHATHGWMNPLIGRPYYIPVSTRNLSTNGIVSTMYGIATNLVSSFLSKMRYKNEKKLNLGARWRGFTLWNKVLSLVFRAQNIWIKYGNSPGEFFTLNNFNVLK